MLKRWEWEEVEERCKDCVGGSHSIFTTTELAGLFLSLMFPLIQTHFRGHSLSFYLSTHAPLSPLSSIIYLMRTHTQIHTLTHRYLHVKRTSAFFFSSLQSHPNTSTHMTQTLYMVHSGPDLFMFIYKLRSRTCICLLLML